MDTGENGSGLYEENIAVKARLVLHFDINKTILMSDRAQAGFYHFICSDDRICKSVGIICKSRDPHGSHFIIALWHYKIKPRHHMQDASTDHMINVLLCECAWGRLEPGPKWVPVGRLATDRCADPPRLHPLVSDLGCLLLMNSLSVPAPLPNFTAPFRVFGTDCPWPGSAASSGCEAWTSRAES